MRQTRAIDFVDGWWETITKWLTNFVTSRLPFVLLLSIYQLKGTLATFTFNCRFRFYFFFTILFPLFERKFLSIDEWKSFHSFISSVNDHKYNNSKGICFAHSSPSKWKHSLLVAEIWNEWHFCTQIYYHTAHRNRRKGLDNGGGKSSRWAHANKLSILILPAPFTTK